MDRETVYEFGVQSGLLMKGQDFGFKFDEVMKLAELVAAEKDKKIERLQAERDAAVKDAERYQWLKQMWTTTLLDGSIQMANSHGIRCKSVSEIDAAIDAARGEK